MKQITYIFILFLVFCFSAHAQSNNGVCPHINLNVPDEMLQPEEPVIFTVKVEDAEKTSNLQYFWIIPRGKIIKGQGETRVEFAANEEANNANIAVAVKVIGLPETCADTVSTFVSVAGLPIGEPVYRIEKVPFDMSYKQAIDSFITEIINTPNSEGLIVVRFDKRDSRKHKITLLKNINKYVSYRKADKRRITFAIKEVDYEQTEFWIVLQGAKFPESGNGDYKRISEDNYQIFKAEEFTQKLNNLCLKNADF